MSILSVSAPFRIAFKRQVNLLAENNYGLEAGGGGICIGMSS